MDAGARKLLETATIETLHANNFSRSSTQATQVLTDLLSRYLTLLTETCARYAEHAGRLRLSAQDAAAALGELGLDVDELKEYCGAEGRELARYARHSLRRTEDVSEFKAALSAGMPEDVDAIPLVYAPMSLETPEPSDEEYEASSESEGEDIQENESIQNGTVTEKEAIAALTAVMEESIAQSQPSQQQHETASGERIVSSPRPVTPTLPLSPISNPATPPRKRPRTAAWSPPPYVPDFLPPFPTNSTRHSPSAPDERDIDGEPYAAHHPTVKLERPLTPPPDSGSSGSADYMRPTPFAQSSLAAMPWHLPDPPPAILRLPPTLPAAANPNALPRPEEAILFALHHALTNKPPSSPPPPPAHPARYRVALKLAEQTEKQSRWELPPTLYASSAPGLPRVAPVGPGYPVPVAYDERAKEAKDKGKEMELEQAAPTFPGLARRTVIPHERLAPVVNGYTSKMSPLLQGVVEYGVYQRSAKLSHPPVLSRGPQKLTYGPGIAAPWNSGPTPATTATVSTPLLNGGGGGGAGKSKEKEKEDKDAAPKPLPDARLYATWNWDEKSFKEPLPPGHHGHGHGLGGTGGRRPRMGSVQLSVGPIGNGKRARSESHS